MASYRVRCAAPRDEAALYQICLQTGDSGRDATPLFRDKALLGHLYSAPYLALEPQLAFVAEGGSGVCGYVVAAFDTELFNRQLEKKWLPRLRRAYRRPPPAKDRSLDAMLVAKLFEPPTLLPVDLKSYPSHLHINLLRFARGAGVGRRLMERELSALRELGSRGVHLGVAAVNDRAIGFYRHIGFDVLHRAPSFLVMGLKL